MALYIDSLLLLLFAVAAFLHGVAGLGFPFLTTSILVNFFPLETVIVMVLLPSMMMYVVVILSQRRGNILEEIHYYLKNYWLLILASFVGSYFGVSLLFWVNAGYIHLLLAFTLIFYVITNFRGQAWKIPVNKGTLLFFGVLAGFVGGSTNATSPLLMIYLLSTDKSKHEIVKAGNFCYLVGKCVQLWLLHEHLLEQPPSIMLLFIFISFLSLYFLRLGIRLRERISHLLFSRIILVILLLLSIRAFFNGFTLLI